MVVKVKQIYPRKRIVAIRIGREFYYALKTRADAMGISMDDLLDLYVRCLALGRFECSDPKGQLFAMQIRFVRENYPEVYSDLVRKCPLSAAPSEEVTKNG